MSATTLDMETAVLPRARVRSLGWVVLAALLLPAAFLALPYVDGAQPFHSLEVSGPMQRVEASSVRTALATQLTQGFWDVDLIAARNAVEALPWVAHARVERSWPATLRVRVWERQAFARWDDQRLLDTDARVFKPAAVDLDATLPLLGGISGQEREVMDAFQRLQGRLKGTAFELAGLRQDARGEWFARSVAGIDLRFGRGDPDLHLELLNGTVLEALRNRLPDVDYVDLRYTNGFAVNWRKPAAEGSASHG
jgi:cell division protein FtsQ